MTSVTVEFGGIPFWLVESIHEYFVLQCSHPAVRTVIEEALLFGFNQTRGLTASALLYSPLEFSRIWDGDFDVQVLNGVFGQDHLRTIIG